MIPSTSACSVLAAASLTLTLARLNTVVHKSTGERAPVAFIVDARVDARCVSDTAVVWLAHSSNKDSHWFLTRNDAS